MERRENMAKETNAAKKARAAEIIKRLGKEYPDADCELRWKNPLELLVATILSAQATDVHVNEVTRGLFKKYKKVQDYAKVSQEELQEDVKSLGFFRNKAKFIRLASQEILTKHGGKVPDSMEDLNALPGVARKTANVVLGTAFGVASGVVVDTHVWRLAQRMGLSPMTRKVGDKIEADLMEVFPQDKWVFMGHALIWHGRRVCSARKPKCEGCTLSDVCPKRGVK